MKNDERMIVKIIKEICEEENIDYTSFSYDWILRLCKNNQVGFVFGYNFGANNATSAHICDDKSATSEVLLFTGIPTVEHMFFMSPNNIFYIGGNGNWSRIQRMLEKYGKLVCKANEGNGGNMVFLVENPVQLEDAVHRIFKQHRSMAISPFFHIIKEYRVIVLNGKVKLAYSKNIPFIKGDGKKSIRQLLLEFMTDNELLLTLEYNEKILGHVLLDGEIWNINWKSNLGQGANPELVADRTLLSELSNLAIKAASAISINFASIDIIKTNEGLKVLEINCGIMMENFIRSTQQNYDIAKEIYRDAVHSMIKSNE
jgi:glutathione synthase/RimK-type ligase-like ATP-grasp enzyme